MGCPIGGTRPSKAHERFRRLRKMDRSDNFVFGVGGGLRLTGKPQGQMTSLAILDSCEEREISYAEFSEFSKLRDPQSRPIDFSGNHWDFWVFDKDFRRLCLFRKDGFKYIGLKAELMHPDLMPFEQQESNSVAVRRFIKNAEVERYHWDDGDWNGKYLQFWKRKARECTHWGLDRDFGMSSFHICHSDKELFNQLAGAIQPGEEKKTNPAALICKSLCFVRRQDKSHWLVMNEDTVLHHGLDLSRIANCDGEERFSGFLHLLRNGGRDRANPRGYLPSR